MTAPRVLINVFHPNLAASRANRLIVDELRQLPAATVRDAQKACPDWKIDVAREQELLVAHDLIVFQHPCAAKGGRSIPGRKRSGMVAACQPSLHRADGPGGPELAKSTPLRDSLVDWHDSLERAGHRDRASEKELSSSD